MTGWVVLGNGERRPLADFDRRLAARIIDWILIGVAVYLLWLPFSSRITGWFAVLFFLALICLILGVVYEVVLTALFGRTLGKKVFGLKVVRADNGGAPGWGRSLSRYLTLNLANLLPVLGNAVSLFVYLSPAFSDLLQGLHDKAAATVVVDQRGRPGPAEGPSAAGPEVALSAAGMVVLGNGGQHRLAGFGRRLSARLLDFVILFAVAALLLLLWLTRSVDSIQQVIQDSLQQLTSSFEKTAAALGGIDLTGDGDAIMDVLRSLWDSLKQLWHLFVQAVNDVISAFVSAVQGLFSTLIGIAAGAVLYEILMIGLLGRTLGKMIVRAKVVRAADGRRPGIVKAVIRYLTLNIPLISPLVRLSPSFYDTRRGWHDRAASTVVIRPLPRRRRTAPDEEPASDEGGGDSSGADPAAAEPVAGPGR